MFNQEKWLKQIKLEDGYYIAGFVDGEGSFNVSLRRRPDHKLGWQVKLSFNVSQRDRVILSWMKDIIGCGTLRTRQDGVVYYEVTNVAMLNEKIIPFFERFHFHSAAKKTNFSLFKKIVKIYSQSGLNQKSFEQMVQIREILNEGRGRKRKYEAKDVLTGKSSETIR